MLNNSTRSLDLVTSPDLDPLFLRPRRTGVESAWYGHVPFAHWLVAACQPRLLIELGTHNGVSYAAFCEALARFGGNGRAFAIDTWAGDDHAGHYGADVYNDLKRFHDEHYAGFSEMLRCTFDAALPYFAEASVDLLHIDGLHTYEAVRSDWEAWRPKLSERAVVLFHDTNVRERGFGVWRLWDELRGAYPHFEFLHGHGLGVLAYGDAVAQGVQDLCALDDARMVGAVRQRFALLGERWVEAQGRRSNIAAQQAAEAALAGATLEVAAMAAERDRLGESERRLMAALADADAAVEAARAEQAALTDSQTRLTAALENADADVRSLRERLEEREAEAELLRIQTSPASDATEIADIKRQLAAREFDLAALRAHHHAVVSSPAWRATAPARQFGQRFPRAALHAAKAARLGAAAVTGRLPGQLRLRRQVREDAKLLAASPLFDPARYLARYPEVAQSGSDPLWHYIWTGAAAGYDPHPLFDSRWYAAQHPEIAARQVNPLAHYIREGAAADADPHPLFDAAFYVAQEPGAAGRALLHYLETGATKGRCPNPLFDTGAYWDDYLKGRDLADDPLSHYVLRGAAAGLDPHMLFDTDWYAATYKDSVGWNPLAHYLKQGKARGHAPCLVAAQSAEPLPAVRFAPHASPDVSIVIPCYGRLFDTLRCLASIMVHSGTEVTYEVIVADDRPDAPTAGRLSQVPGLRVEQNPHNLGFLRNCNRAAELAEGRYVLFLNTDASVHPGWLAPLVRLADSDPRIGMVGSKLLNADGAVQEAGGVLHRNGWGFPYGRGQDAERPEYGFVREVDVVIGACMLIRTAAWAAAGGFDERYAPAYYEEFDLAFTLRDRGWRVMYQPASQVTHFDSASYGAAERDRQSTINHAQFCRKWARALPAQPSPETPPYVARERGVLGRILVVDDHVPEPDKHAGAVATFDWLRLLRGMGLRVTYKPHDQARPEPYTGVLQQMGVEVLYGPVDLPAWLEENGRCLDWVWVARPAVAEPLLEALRAFAPGKLIYFTHDLHFLREQRRFELDRDPWHRDEARRLRRLERDIFRQARLVLTPSADEVPVIKDLVPEADVRAIPLYSVPAAPLSAWTAEQFAGRSAVLFVGGYDHPPNVDAARWLVDEIMPLVWADVPEAMLILAGSRPPEALLSLAGRRVEVPGWAPDLGPLYARARLSLNPLRYGAGVKGKIVASLQAGLPIVTTTLGNEGLGLEAGTQALIGDTAGLLSRHAASLLRDPALCAAMANAGMAMVRQRFGEEGLRRALLSALQRDLCPVCGRFARSDQPVLACEACGAGEQERALAGVAIRPWRPRGVSSLREAAPFIGCARVPDGAMAKAVPAGCDAGGVDLLIGLDQPRHDMVRPGGRLVSPAFDTSRLLADGWQVWLHESGPAIVEAMRPKTAG